MVCWTCLTSVIKTKRRKNISLIFLCLRSSQRSELLVINNLRKNKNVKPKTNWKKEYNVALIVSYLSAYAHNKKFSQYDSKERTEKWYLINGTIFIDVKGNNNLRYRLTILFINTYILVIFQVLDKCTRYMQKTTKKWQKRHRHVSSLNIRNL